jgi:hypothetical protein
VWAELKPRDGAPCWLDSVPVGAWLDARERMMGPAKAEFVRDQR